jgi:hypothetical protein
MEKKTKIMCNDSVLKTVTCARGLAVAGLPGAASACQGLARTGQPGLRPSRDTSAGPDRGQPEQAQAGKMGAGPAGGEAHQPSQDSSRASPGRTHPAPAHAGTCCAPAQAGIAPLRPRRAASKPAEPDDLLRQITDPARAQSTHNRPGKG